MSINYNPKIVTDGLVLCLDAANAKSFDANENLLTYSEQFEDGAWFKVRASVASNVALAPNGTLTADKLVEDTTANNNHRLARGISITANSVCTLSFYAKAGERTWVMAYLYATGGMAAFFDLSNGVVGNTSGAVTTAISSEGNGWYRCSISGQVSGSTADIWILTSLANNQTYTGDGASGIYLWGAQFEIASTASRYYRTVATAKNRGTVLIDISGNNSVVTLTNGPTYSSLNNGILNFDGVDDYGECASTIFTATGNCTIGVWCKSNNYITQAGIIGNKAYYATGQGLAIGNISNPTRPYLIINTDTETKNISFTDASTYDWSYFVGVKSANNINAYTNGVLVNSTTYNGTVTTDYSSNISIGRYLGSSRRWDGSLSYIQCYNKALSTSEILQNFNALRGRFGI